MREKEGKSERHRDKQREMDGWKGDKIQGEKQRESWKSGERESEGWK